MLVNAGNIDLSGRFAKVGRVSFGLVWTALKFKPLFIHFSQYFISEVDVTILVYFYEDIRKVCVVYSLESLYYDALSPSKDDSGGVLHPHMVEQLSVMF